MIILEPVIETGRARGFTAWSVGARLDAEGLALSGELTWALPLAGTTVSSLGRAFAAHFNVSTS